MLCVIQTTGKHELVHLPEASHFRCHVEFACYAQPAAACPGLLQEHSSCLKNLAVLASCCGARGKLLCRYAAHLEAAAVAGILAAEFNSR